jgi:MFS family permease
MFAATSVGGLVAGAVMSMLPPVRRAGLWMLMGVVVYGICLCGFAASTSFWLSLVMLAGTGAGNGVSAALRGALTQLSTPDRLRGRVASVNALFSNGGPQLGQMEAGLVAELTSTPFSALSGGLATLALAIGAFCVPLVRKFEAPVDPLEPPSKSPAPVAAGVREPSAGT